MKNLLEGVAEDTDSIGRHKQLYIKQIVDETGGRTYSIRTYTFGWAEKKRSHFLPNYSFTIRLVFYYEPLPIIKNHQMSPLTFASAPEYKITSNTCQYIFFLTT